MLYSGYQSVSISGHITWLWPLSSTLRRRFTGRSFREPTLFHYYFRGCSVTYWSIWAILLSPILSIATIVESDSLSINGHSWQDIRHLYEPHLGHQLQCHHKLSRHSRISFPRSLYHLPLQHLCLRSLILLLLPLMLFYQLHLLHLRPSSPFLP